MQDINESGLLPFQPLAIYGSIYINMKAIILTVWFIIEFPKNQLKPTYYKIY